MYAGDRFTIQPARWHRVPVRELRALRRAVNLSQQEFAALLGVPINTFRMWDSGLRSARSSMRIRSVQSLRLLDRVRRGKALKPRRRRLTKDAGSVERRERDYIEAVS